MPPQRAHNKWRFIVRDENGNRKWKSYDDYDSCYRDWLEYRNRRKSVQDVEVNYIEQYTDVDSLWDYAVQHTSQKRNDTPYIELPNQSFALVFLSDLHIGSRSTDYDAIRRDAEIVRNTDGMYAIFHGDGIDNWIVGKLQGLQRGQAVPFDDEMALFQAWLTTLGDKLIAVVAGNHDNWTKKIAGIDFLRNITPPHTLYDANQLLLRIQWGNNAKTIAVRHKWRGTSILNPTHGLERASKDIDADIYVGGHTHIGTLFRDFIVRDKDRTAILTGTYKINDAFAEELGLPPSRHRGCGAVVFGRDGSAVFLRNLDEASRYLKFKRLEEQSNEHEKD